MTKQKEAGQRQVIRVIYPRRAGRHHEIMPIHAKIMENKKLRMQRSTSSSLR
jgi:hypothetical protein